MNPDLVIYPVCALIGWWLLDTAWRKLLGEWRINRAHQVEAESRRRELLRAELYQEAVRNRED